MKTTHKYIIILAFSITLFSCNTNTYKIKGTVDKSLKADSLFLFQEGLTEAGKELNKTKVIDGKFYFEGTIDTIQKVLIGEKGKESPIGVYFILENKGKYTIKINPDFTYIEGGNGIQEKIYGFYNSKEFNAILNEKKKIIPRFNTIDIEDIDNQDEFFSMSRKLDSLDRRLFEIEDIAKRKIIEDDKESTISKMLALTTSQDFVNYDTEKRYELLDKYEKEIGNHHNIKIYKQFLQSQSDIKNMKETVANGNPYKPISGLDKTGKETSIIPVIENNEFTLLEFWASWCSPCRAEIPTLKKAYEKYKKKGFEIYSFSIDGNKNEWETALKEEKTPWINVITEGKVGVIYQNNYGIDGIPASFLINKEGIIVASNEDLTGDGLEETLNKLYNK